MSRLAVCPGCARHVRVTEVACPFCGLAFDAAFARTPSPRRPVGRLSRAALFAIGSAAAVTAIDCSSSSTDQSTFEPDDTFDGASQASLYGGPAIDSGASVPDAPEVDADAATDADASSDAATD